ncbi:MAG: DEAD/DEAH box helicase [Erysipelotrichaceae bacterium]
MKFTNYSLKERTNEFIKINGFEEMTPIQQEVIPVARKKRDVVGISKTGSGKTHAFLISIFELIDFDDQNTQVLISAPTRELATQLYEKTTMMCQVEPRLKVLLASGGMDNNKMMEQLKKQPQIIVGTVGRIKDLCVNKNLIRVENVKLLVVDEADMTLEFGFLEDLDTVASKMPENLQMLVFSATIPQALYSFLKKYMYDPVIVRIDDDKDIKPNIDHILINCKHKTYQQQLLDILPGFTPYLCLIFANSRKEVASTAAFLRENDYKVLELHGDLEARERKNALKSLQSNEYTYVVCSDIAARGIDIEMVSHVISLGLPRELEYYIHRSGRTGRYKKHGICYLLYTEKDNNGIEMLKKQKIQFKTQVYKNGEWKELSNTKKRKKTSNDELEISIAKMLTKKKTQVKPGYKKKRSEEIQKLKRKQKRAMIQESINKIRKQKYKAAGKKDD